jgi:2-polyprenyl-3-methyl-5-hydroxy-6-metoxy-1,4-benzoquinol methylase
MGMSKSFFLFILLLSMNVWSRNPIPASRFQYLTGAKITRDSKTDWDQRYNKPQFIFGKRPAKFLADNYSFIQPESTVLDMGMGEGRNAVFLAQKGYKVTGVDISSVAVKKAQLLSKEYGVKIKGIVASLKEHKFPPESFDSVICFYYVDRSLIEKIKTWLKPGGVIIYEAYTLRHKAAASLKNEPDDFFLREQELLKLFSDMKVLKFEEPIHEKEYRSSIILQKN